MEPVNIVMRLFVIWKKANRCILMRFARDNSELEGKGERAIDLATKVIRCKHRF
jgi:hypothetical protein